MEVIHTEYVGDYRCVPPHLAREGSPPFPPPFRIFTLGAWHRPSLEHSLSKRGAESTATASGSIQTQQVTNLDLNKLFRGFCADKGLSMPGLELLLFPPSALHIYLEELFLGHQQRTALCKAIQQYSPHLGASWLLVKQVVASFLQCGVSGTVPQQAWHGERKDTLPNACYTPGF